MTFRFDAEAFYVAIDRVRRQRRLSWRAVRRETGVPSSTFTRMGLYWRNPSADTIARLVMWSLLTDIRPYITQAPAGQDSL